MNKKFSFLFIGLVILGVGIVQGAGLGEAVDAPSLTWVTGGNAEWFAEGTTWYSLNEAAQSGAIGNSQSSYLKTNVTGPGTLRFWWKVSSEYDADFLRFFIDGTPQNRISGTVNWSQRSYPISPGTHTLEWRYKKNSSYSRGSDCGWVDKVEFIPHGITVVNPDGGENWQQGTVQTISWQYSGNPGSSVKIELLNGTTNLLISSSTSIGSGGSGSRSWTIPQTQPLGSDYRIRITSTSNSIFTDTSDADFTISAAPPTLWEIIADLQASVAALWTNATEQQAAIDAIQPGSTVSFGNWITHDQYGYPFIEGINYQAGTDGFVCAYATDMWSEGLVTIRGSSGPSPATMETRIYSHAVQHTEGGIAEPGGITMPVRAGEYWRVDMPAIWSLAGNTSIQFIPLTP